MAVGLLELHQVAHRVDRWQQGGLCFDARLDAYLFAEADAQVVWLGLAHAGGDLSY